MLILGIESSALTASAAILKDDIVLAEYTVNYQKTHSQTLLPMLDELVRMTQVNLSELDAVAVSAGPGSFTGLRIGSATAKGICQALDIPLAEISTLEAMACGCFGVEGLICPVVDARRKQLYTAIYRFRQDLTMECVLEPSILLVDELIKLLGTYQERVMFTGDGVQTYEELFRQQLPKAVMSPAICRSPRAAAVAQLGEQRFLEGKCIPAGEHRPIYLKKSQAEQEREAGIYTKGSLKPGDNGTTIGIR